MPCYKLPVILINLLIVFFLQPVTSIRVFNPCINCFSPLFLFLKLLSNVTLLPSSRAWLFWLPADNHGMLQLNFYFLLSLFSKLIDLLNLELLNKFQSGFCPGCYPFCRFFHVSSNNSCKYLMTSIQTGKGGIISLTV